MKKINLGITGCLGRMGQQIIKSVKSDRNFKLIVLTENRKIKKKINGIKISKNTLESLRKTDLIICWPIRPKHPVIPKLIFFIRR